MATVTAEVSHRGAESWGRFQSVSWAGGATLAMDHAG
jgi:hypothetical protein